MELLLRDTFMGWEPDQFYAVKCEADEAHAVDWELEKAKTLEPKYEVSEPGLDDLDIFNSGIAQFGSAIDADITDLGKNSD